MPHLQTQRVLHGSFQERPLVRKLYKQKRGNESMGKRKNRHCNSKQEVLQREYERRRQQSRGNGLTKQLKLINRVKPAIERARANMAEKNRRESQNDVD